MVFSHRQQNSSGPQQIPHDIFSTVSPPTHVDPFADAFADTFAPPAVYNPDIGQASHEAAIAWHTGLSPPSMSTYGIPTQFELGHMLADEAYTPPTFSHYDGTPYIPTSLQFESRPIIPDLQQTFETDLPKSYFTRKATCSSMFRVEGNDANGMMAKDESFGQELKAVAQSLEHTGSNCFATLKRCIPEGHTLQSLVAKFSDSQCHVICPYPTCSRKVKVPNFPKHFAPHIAKDYGRYLAGEREGLHTLRPEFAPLFPSVGKYKCLKEGCTWESVLTRGDMALARHVSDAQHEQMGGGIHAEKVLGGAIRKRKQSSKDNSEKELSGKRSRK